MKQSTKLLSLVLAIVMAFSCMSVIGNAADTISDASKVTYDSIDDALLTPEQVSDIALDLVDGLLSGLDIGDNGVIELIGIEILNLSDLNHALDSLYDLATGFLFRMVSGLTGDLKNLTFAPLQWKETGSAVQRGNGNLQVILHLVDFIGCDQNAGVLKKAVYGIQGSDSRGITLGTLGSILGLDLGDINDILTNLDGFVGDLIYDMLLHGSYRHPLNAEELKAAGQSLPYDGSLDSMLNNAILNLVVDPQDKDDESETGWDENSILIPSIKAELGENEKNRATVLSNINIDNKSVFDILDYAAQFAIDDLGVLALNHNLKKGLMEAVDVELVEIDKKDVPADVMAVFTNEAAYTTYISYDCMQKDEATGEWYYTTKETQDKVVNGKPVKDEEGNVVTERVPVYYKANTALANEFYDLINWDYKIYKTSENVDENDAVFTEAEVKAGKALAPNTIDYNYFVTGENGYGSLVESLNHLVYIVYMNALNEEVRDDFKNVTDSEGWVDGSTTEKINDNLNNLIKYLLVKFPGMIFGKSSAYALEKEAYLNENDENTEATYFAEKYANMSLIDIVALIGPSFFEDVMPQLVMPVDENGAYAFAKTENGQSVALLQFGALVLREFITEIAPNVNYDAVIFADGTLTSATGRQFATHTPEEWFNIILNMGVDVGYTYLGNITNFGDKLIFTDDGTSFATKEFRTTTLPEAPTAETAVTDTRWKGMLDEAINWAVGYVGLGSNGVITGINPDKIATMDGDPLGKLSYVLNTILPLGFVNGCESANYDLDVEIVFNKLKTLLTTFDFTALTSLFGRNGIDGSVLKRGNILATPVVPMVLGLVNDILNLVFGKTIFPVTNTLDNVLVQDNLSTVVYNILTGLNGVRESLLISALPVVGKLIKGWGTEQAFGNPEVSAPQVIQLNTAGTLVDGDGNATTETITVKNGANGLWRSWVDANGRQYDDQYQIELKEVRFVDVETNKAFSTSNVSYSEMTTGLVDYGKNATFKVSVSGLDGSKIVRMDIDYKVYEGETEMVAGATYTTSVYSYFSTVPTDEGVRVQIAGDQLEFGHYTADFIDISGTDDDIKGQIEASNLVYFKRTKSHDSNKINKGGQVIGSSNDTTVVPGTATLTDELGKGSNRSWDPLQMFTNAEQPCVGGAENLLGQVDEGDRSFNITGATIDMANFNKKPGDKTELTFSLAVNKDDCNTTAVTGDAKVTLVYYDGAARGEIESAARDEINRGRVADDYLTEGYSFADRVLAPETVDNEVTGEKILKETNSKLTAWVDADGEPLADDIAVTPDDENEEIGTYYIDEVKYTAKLVTKIPNNTAWSNYVTALKAAAAASLDGLKVNGSFDYGTILDDLNAAAIDIGYCEAEGDADPTVPNAITDLKTILNDVEEATTDRYDYTDYMMWRLNRLNDARDDAAYYINLKKDADRAYANVDKKFPYTSIEKDDLTALVALTENKEEIADKGYSELILALLEDLTTEEEAAKKAWLNDRDKEYAGVTAFDIALAKSMLEKTSARLRNRDYKGANGEADTTYLATEIASCKAMFTDSSLYTEKSWNRYADALTDAEAVVNGDSQKDAFDKKWELLCCRNELVLVEEAADYSELEALIEQAKFALAHQTMYDNTKKELGQVLAELGIEGEVVTADGYGINLFPGSALYTSAEPYTTEDQDIIDSAADDLKEALARLKFKGLGIAAVEGNGDVDYSGETTIVFDDDTTEEDESVVVKLATIGAGMNEDAVKALFNVTATGATVGADNVTVSNDRHYSIEQYEKDEDGNYVLDDEGNKVLAPFQGFAGTNSVVTFYTVQDGIKIPVATIKLVVNGDINGDGTVDVIDAAQMHLATNNMATLEGCYFVAGNLAGATDATRVIDGDDYTQVINAVVGPEAA